MSDKINLTKFAEKVSMAAQLAVVLEVSAYPKPGNISRLQKFKDTSLDHFLAGGIAIGPTVKLATLRGIKAGQGKIPLKLLRVGHYIEKCVKESRDWHSGGNTNLGTVSLLIPLSTAAGLEWAKGEFKPEKLGLTVKEIIRETTVDDALCFYRAVRLADAGGLGSPPKGYPDVLDPEFPGKLRKSSLTLCKVLEACKGLDSICRELVEDMPITFKIGYPALVKAFKRCRDINRAIVQAYFKILAAEPDSLIARRSGVEEARAVSEMAAEVLRLGGVFTEEGWKAILKMDEKLKTPDNRLNPGTTADLTASSLLVFLLAGFKP